ncbi:hypothetical protein BG005_003454 [Podila minutissima]|nr:hypothetical protein BG005_003454 [Podila minutissima]
MFDCLGVLIESALGAIRHIIDVRGQASVLVVTRLDEVYHVDVSISVASGGDFKIMSVNYADRALVPDMGLNLHGSFVYG